MTVTLITPTGWRPKAFALCEKWMARQTYKGSIQWIVVSDDKPDSPTLCTMDQEYYPGPKVWRPGHNYQRYNLDLAMTKVRGDYVFLIEDDDNFKPQYIELMLDLLKHAELVGEAASVYYNLKVKGFKEMKNYTHASLTQTAFRKSYIPHFMAALHSAERFFDMTLWTKAIYGNHKRLLISNSDLVVGMKGLPGRTGIGYGHTNTHEFTPDHQYVKLVQLVGQEDAKLYMEMMGK